MLTVDTSDTMTQMTGLCGAPKVNTRETIEILEAQNQADGDDAGGQLALYGLALSERAQTAPPSALLGRFAHSGSACRMS